MPQRFDRRSVLSNLALAVATAGAGLPLMTTRARAEGAFDGRTLLLMVDDPGCIYCAKWEREVESGYRKSDEGTFAPLEKRHKGHADLGAIKRLAYTPTFVLLRDGTEVGRIVGYAGADWFWGEIDSLFRRAGYVPGSPAAKVDERRT